MNPQNTVKIQSKPWLFRKGVSGNPRGKPRGTRHFSSIVRQALTDSVGVNSLGEPITTDKAIVSVLIKKAIKGDLKAIKFIFDKIEGKADDGIEVYEETLHKEHWDLEEIRRKLYLS